MAEDKFLEEVLKTFGEHTIISESSEIIPISTGSISLDASIGIGGIPRGRITEIFGSEGTGKTTIALCLARSALEAGEKVLYIDAENMLDYSLVEAIIGDALDKSRLAILNPETGEDAFRMVEMGVNSGTFSLVILDSIGALAPKKEKEDDLEDHNVALIARLVTKVLHRISFQVKATNTALVLLNQVRDKVGSFMGGFETPGGHALKHFSALRIALTKGAQISTGTAKAGTKEVYGVDVNFVIRKNKLAAPFRGFHLPIIFGKGIDSAMDSLEFCTMLGILKKSGAFYKLDGEVLGQGKLAAAEALRGNKLALDKMREKVYNILNINNTVVEHTAVIVEEEKE